MPLVPSKTSDELATADASKTVHIRSIRVDYKDVERKRPVSVGIKTDNGNPHFSRQYRQNEDIIWDLDMRIALSARLSIILREHRHLHSDKECKIPIQITNNLIIKPILVIDSTELNSKKIALTIHFEAAGPFIDLIHHLIEESQSRMDNMKIFLERLGKACEVLNYIVNVSELATDIHPAANAAVFAVKQLYEACKKQQECHSAASELISEIADFLPFVELPMHCPKANISAQTVGRMLELFEEITRMIIQYSDSTVIGMLLNNCIEEVNHKKEELRRLKDTFDWCVKTETWKTVLKIESYVGDTTLTRLRPVPQAFYKLENACFEGSRRETLQVIEDWSKSESKLFWLYGSAKSGKSAIAHTAARLFDAQNRLAGCFFCNADDHERQSPERIMPTIAYQLSKWHRDYRSIVLDILQSRSELDLESGLERQFELLVKQPIAQSSVCHPPLDSSLIIVLDALDECCDSANSRHHFATYISNISRVAPWLKVFVSSAKLPELEACFVQDNNQYWDISDGYLDLQSDIAVYARYITACQSSPVKESYDIKKQAYGLFSRIHRVLQSFQEGDNPDYFIPDRFVPRQEAATALFLTVLECVKRIKPNDEKSTATHLDVLVVASCIAPEQPLTESLLLYFLEPLHPGVTLDVLQNAIKSLYPFMDRDADGKIFTILPTETFVDTFPEQAQMGHVWMDPRLLKVQMAEQCLSTLHSQLKFNICSFGSSHLRNEDVPDLDSKVDQDISEVLRYSCLHWMGHVLHAEDGREFQGFVAELFCSSKALFWIEVLGLLGLLEKGKEMLLQCAEFFKDVDEIVCSATELHEFICTFHSVINASTPHLYISALAWVPPDSTIVQHTSAAFKGWQSSLSDELPKQVYLANTSESPLQRKANISLLKGDTSDLLIAKYTPDGSKIVSSTYDGKLQIWNPKSGEAMSETFKCHVPTIRAISYSRDGSRIASASKDGKLRLWDVHTAALLFESQEAHKYGISTLAYSPDGTRIVTGSDDQTLRTWDAQSGAFVGEPLTGHTGPVYAVAYAPDGHRIVSGSDDRTLRIWDAQSGAQVGRPLRGHQDRVRAVAYAPDGSRIVSGSGDRTLRIWDAQSGKPIGVPLKGHDRVINCVAYCPDGTKIVSGSDDKTLCIWDARTGGLVCEPLRGHTDLVRSVAYSPDAHRIVSGSGDNTLRIWDAHSGEHIGDPFSGHERLVVSAAYSPDGNEIASGSYDGTIRIWDAHNGTCIRRFICESRWDPDTQCFLTIAKSYSKLSITHTSNPSTIPDDGWLRTLDGGLFLWIPSEHRRSICHVGQVRIPNDENGKLMTIDWRKIPHGENWTNIMHAGALED